MDHSHLNPQQKGLRVAIIGGGVCGLVCAVSLMKAGVDVHLYEASVRAALRMSRMYAHPEHFLSRNLVRSEQVSASVRCFLRKFWQLFKVSFRRSERYTRA